MQFYLNDQLFLVVAKMEEKKWGKSYYIYIYLGKRCTTCFVYKPFCLKGPSVIYYFYLFRMAAIFISNFDIVF